MPTAPHAIALGSAVLSAVATILIHRGLRRSNFYAGYWINVAVGVVALWSAVLWLVPGAEYRWSVVPYFVASGLVGIPLAGTAPLFVLLLTVVLPGRIERLGWRVVVGAILVVAGVFMLFHRWSV